MYGVGRFTLWSYQESHRHDQKGEFHPGGGAKIEIVVGPQGQIIGLHIDDPRTAKAIKEIWIEYLRDDGETKDRPSLDLVIESIGFTPSAKVE